MKKEIQGILGLDLSMKTILIEDIFTKDNVMVIWGELLVELFVVVLDIIVLILPPYRKKK